MTDSGRLWIFELGWSCDESTVPIRGAFHSAEQIINLAIHDVPILPRWSAGRTILIGDAAHAVAHSGQTLRVTPAIEAGLADHVWSIEEICNLVAPKKAVSNVKATERAMVLKALSGSPSGLWESKMTHYPQMQ